MSLCLELRTIKSPYSIRNSSRNKNLCTYETHTDYSLSLTASSEYTSACQWLWCWSETENCVCTNCAAAVCVTLPVLHASHSPSPQKNNVHFQVFKLKRNNQDVPPEPDIGIICAWFFNSITWMQLHAHFAISHSSQAENVWGAENVKTCTSDESATRLSGYSTTILGWIHTSHPESGPVCAFTLTWSWADWNAKVQEDPMKMIPMKNVGWLQ